MKVSKFLVASLMGACLILTGCNNSQPVSSEIKVTEISLSDAKMTSRTGSSTRLVATVLPENATNKSYTWSTSDDKVLTVSNDGLIKSVAPGSATITATTADGSFKASCEFTVLAEESVVDGNGFVFALNEKKDSYAAYYNGDKTVTNVTVPSTVYGLPVETILSGSFYGMDELESVTLPSDLVEIEDGSFVGNDSLTTLKVGSEDLHLFSVNGVLAHDGDVLIGENNFESVIVPTINIGGENEKGDIVVTAEGIEGLVDSIDYDIAMNDVSPIAVKGNKAISTAAPATIETGAHGIYRNNTIALKKGDKVLDEVTLNEINVYTNEYNVAMLTATYPTTIFTLKAPTITDNGKIPTYVLLERYAAYNWDNLQWNIRAIPNVAREDATSASNSRFFGNAHDWMKSYIADLYYGNPNAHFNFFFTDLSVDYFYYTVVAQAIPTSAYKLVLLSDGTASASILNRVYGVDSDGNPSGWHQRLLASLTKVASYIYENGWDRDYIAANLLDPNGPAASYTGVPAFFFANHAYATLCLFSDNCEWWLNRLRAGENLSAINAIDPEFVSTILSTKGLTQNIYANSLLAGLSAEDQAKFKTIFHFDSDSFDASREAGKKIMVILGTSWAGEKDNLYDYIKATIAYFGDEYDYYYKPHPGWPTSTCPERNVVFDQLKADGYKVEEMDGAIAAEIIMYFNTDIYLSGYSSTTYASLDESNNGMGACDWTSNTSEYKDFMFTYMAKVAKDSEIATKYSLDADKTYFAVTVNDNITNEKIKEIYDKYDTAIVCVDDSTVTYYKDGVVVNL